MKPSTLIPVFLSLAAFILSILILFSGRTPSFLPDVFLAKIDTSRIASDLDVTDTTGNSIIDRINERIDRVIGRVANQFADSVGIHDVYTAHIMNYCYGDTSTEAIIANETAGVSACTEQTAGYSFDFNGVLEHDLEIGGTNITLEDLRWPDAVADVNRTVRTITRAMFVFIVIGVAASGLSFLLGIIAIFFASSITFLVNAIIVFIGFVALLLGAILSTVATLKLRDGINKHLDQFGVRAYASRALIGMSWGAVVALLLAFIFYIVTMRSVKRVENYGGEKALGTKRRRSTRGWRRWRR